LEELRGHDLPEKQDDRKDLLNSFRQTASLNKTIKRVKREVEVFASKYPVPGIQNVRARR